MVWLTQESCKHDLLYDSTGGFCVWVVLDGHGTVRWLSQLDVGRSQAIAMARRVVRDADAQALFVHCVDLAKVEKRLFEEQAEHPSKPVKVGPSKHQPTLF